MSILTEYKAFIKHGALGGRKPSKVQTLGVIITGTFSDLDEHLVEKHLAEHYDLSSIKRISTVGKKEPTFKYVNRVGKKHKIEVQAFPLETYMYDEWDLYVKRNSNIIYHSDSVIIIYGGKTERLISWYALNVGVRSNPSEGGCVFVNLDDERKFEGAEKEVHDLLKIPYSHAFTDRDRFMEQTFFEIKTHSRENFMKYLAKGKEMSFKEVLQQLTKVYMEHPDIEFYPAVAYVIDKLFIALFWKHKPEFFDEEGDADFEAFNNYLKTEINPKYRERIEKRTESANAIIFHNHWYTWHYIMVDIIRGYKYRGREDFFAALCYGQWISLKYFRDVKE